MPFDGFGRLSLTDYLAAMDITPVPMAILEKHKAKQLRRYRRNSLLTWKPYTLVGVVIGAAFIATHSLSLAPCGAIIGLCAAFLMFLTVSAYCDFAKTRLRQDSRWIDSYAKPRNDHLIPEPIREVVARIRHTKSNEAVLIYGELIQEKTVLDPYILIRWHDEIECLGIWDGKKIIACANMD